MFKRRRIKQSQSLERRLTDEAAKVRDEAKALPPELERNCLIGRARQAESASHMSEWLSCAELQPPK